MFRPNFEKGGGFIIAIAQDWQTNEVLMAAFMDEAAFEETLRSGHVTYFSRSQGKLWKKGETSGHLQYVKEIRVDCDTDAVVIKVDQIGAACHDVYFSCFYRTVQPDGSLKVIRERVFNPSNVYKK